LSWIEGPVRQSRSLAIAISLLPRAAFESIAQMSLSCLTLGSPFGTKKDGKAGELDCRRNAPKLHAD
jgi:hypothetical protein